MTQACPQYYIPASSVNITPNSNGQSSDIGLVIAGKKTKIRVYTRREDMIPMSDGQFQEWDLEGGNRRLNDSDAPYSIYARLSKTNYSDGYIVFARCQEVIDETGAILGWHDKYYRETLGTAVEDYDAAHAGEWYVSGNDSYWFVKLGNVSAPIAGLRTVTFDAGSLDMLASNIMWKQNIEEDIAQINDSAANSRRRIQRIAAAQNWQFQSATVFTADDVAVLEGTTDPFNTDESDLVHPVLSLPSLTQRIIFYASDSEGLPVPGYEGLSDTWTAEHLGEDGYADGAPITVNLPFAAPRVVEGVEIDFLTAMSSLLGGDLPAAEQKELEAREFLGNTVELTNLAHEEILLRGLADPDGVIPSTVVASGLSPWEDLLLPPATRLRATCGMTPEGDIYWQVVAWQTDVRTYTVDTWFFLGLPHLGSDSTD